MARKTSFQKIRDGLKRAIEHVKGTRRLTTRDVVVAGPPEPMAPRQIIALRVKKMNVSQKVFADLTNTAVQTVQAWEQGRTKPSGCALRFLWLLDSEPELVDDLLKPASATAT